MHSYEDRIQALQLYIKLGKRVRATIRQLGYPTGNTLKGWHREYEQRPDLPVGYARSKPKYSHAQKEAAVATSAGQMEAVAEQASSKVRIVSMIFRPFMAKGSSSLS